MSGRGGGRPVGVCEAPGWVVAGMAGPALAGLTLFVAAPFAFALLISLTDARLGSPLPIEWAGLEQYQRVFSSESFRRALLNNLYFAAVVVPAQTGLALAAAVLLNRGVRGTALFRTAFFLPVVFPMSLIAVVWELLYAPGPGRCGEFVPRVRHLRSVDAPRLPS